MMSLELTKFPLRCFAHFVHFEIELSPQLLLHLSRDFLDGNLRRLVLPLSYFIEHPFQNWTRSSSDLLVTVILYVDYSVPVEPVRAELRRIVESTNLWKGDVCVLQVTDATDHAIQLRALFDARDSSASWDLRCLVREKLIQFLQEKYPNALPRVRAEFHGLPSENAGHQQLAAAPGAK